MIRKVFVSLFVLFPTLLMSQDLVIKKDGEIISCKITSVDSSNVYIDVKKDGKVFSTYASKKNIDAFMYNTKISDVVPKEPKPEPIQKSIDTLHPVDRFMVELNFNPFGSEGVFSFEYLQTKYKIGNKTSLRLGIQFDRQKNSKTEEDYNKDEESKPTVFEESKLFGIKPGIEFRILENSKISPYWGFEFSDVKKTTNAEYVEYSTSYDFETSKYTYYEIKTKVDGAFREQINYYTNTYEKERAYHSLGANLLLGSDFYFFKNMYMGFELGLGYEVIKYNKINVTITYEEENEEDIEENYPSYKTKKMALYYNSAFRLGIRF